MKSFLEIAITCLLLLPSSAWAVLDVNAGPDVTLECEAEGGSEFTLHGSVPDGEGLDFSWSTDNDVDLNHDDTLTPTGVFPTGDTLVGLTATTETDSGDDSATITVEDTTPPVVRARAEPHFLWPPNHELREVTVRLRIRDACTSADDFEVELIGATSNEPDDSSGDGHTRDDIQDADTGTDDRQVLLRAERKGNGNGRIYTLTYRVTDPAGNETEVEATVHVPHDARALRDLIDEMGGDRREFEPICPLPKDAAEEFLEVLPSAGDFSTSSACLRACRTWSRGCQGISRGALQCVRSEVRSLLALEHLMCDEERDRGARRDCIRDLRHAQRSARTLERREDRRVHAICTEAAIGCADMCEDYFFTEPFIE